MNSETYGVLPASVVAKVANLPNMNIAALQALWRDVYAAEPYTKKRGLLERRLAYRLQEIEFERHNKTLIQSNKARIQALIEAETQTSKSASNKAYSLPKPGTVLTRFYQGKEYRVMVESEEQFIFEGKRFDSLSRIAREITGTPWSGPVFFNLRKTTRNKTNRKKYD